MLQELLTGRIRLLASTFSRTGYVCGVQACGIEKMRRECANHDVPGPIFDTSMSGLMLTFKANPVHLAAALGAKLANALLGVAGEGAPEVNLEVRLLRAVAVAAARPCRTVPCRRHWG